MNRYTLLTTREVDERLAEIWLASDERKRVTGAANTADSELANTPLVDASFVSEGLWRRDFPPLRFYFSVWDVDHVVTVTAVTTVPNHEP